MDASDSRIPASSSTTSNWGRVVIFSFGGESSRNSKLETRNSKLVQLPSLGSFDSVAFGDGGGRGFGRRQFDEEPGADRKIVLDVNRAAVFGDDARGDREAESSAAIFRRKMREEEAVFVFGRNTVTCVLDADFDGFGVVVHAGRNGDFAQGRGFERFSGVVDEIDDDAAEQAAIGADRRKIFGKRRFQRDAVETAGENFDSLLDHGVRAGGRELGGGEADKLRELVDELRERGDFALDEARAFLGEASELRIERIFNFGRGAAIEEARKTLRRELNRRERILDLVGDAASDFLPRGGFLW